MSAFPSQCAKRCSSGRAAGGPAARIRAGSRLLADQRDTGPYSQWSVNPVLSRATVAPRPTLRSDSANQFLIDCAVGCGGADAAEGTCGGALAVWLPAPELGQAAAVLTPSIGIGGHLAMPPLPHHRAYGSVPRRFGGLSTRHCFHGKQPMTLEAFVGEGAVQRA
jgi:hypothetical protein